MDCYTERAWLIALAARDFPSYRWRDDAAEPGFETVVAFDLPTGQVSWHIADADAWLFKDWPVSAPTHWDGHTTEQKYARIFDLLHWETIL